jgi:hypothetical protein
MFRSRAVQALAPRVGFWNLDIARPVKWSLGIAVSNVNMI